MFPAVMPSSAARRGGVTGLRMSRCTVCGIEARHAVASAYSLLKNCAQAGSFDEAASVFPTAGMETICDRDWARGHEEGPSRPKRLTELDGVNHFPTRNEKSNSYVPTG